MISPSSYHLNRPNQRYNGGGYQTNHRTMSPTGQHFTTSPQIISFSATSPPAAQHYLLATSTPSPSPPTSPTTANPNAINRQRLQVLFSDVENLLAVQREKGVTLRRAGVHLARADRYLEQLEELSYTQLLGKVNLTQVQRMKLSLEILACELVKVVDEQEQLKAATSTLAASAATSTASSKTKASASNSHQQQESPLLKIKQEQQERDAHQLTAYPADDDEDALLLEDDDEMDLRI